MLFNVVLSFNKLEDAIVVRLCTSQIVVRVRPFCEPECGAREGGIELVVSIVESSTFGCGVERSIPMEWNEIDVAACAELEEGLEPSDVVRDGWRA